MGARKSTDRSGQTTPNAHGSGKNSRRRFLKAAGGLGSAAGLSALAGCIGSLGSDDETIRIGTLYDNSGELGFTGEGKDAVTEMFLEEQDYELLGREVELISYDPAGDNTQYQNLTRRIIQEDEVDMLFGALLSSNREAMRPIVNENKQLYSYNDWYEGGVCDQFTFINTTLSSQQRPMIEFMIDNFGPDYYAIVADYNYGTISNQYARFYAEEYGGQPVGEEFVPLGVDEFGSTINDIQQADPDWILSLTIGAPQASFFEQAEAAGLDVPYGSMSNIAGTYEHKTFEPPVMTDTYSCFSYFEEIPTERNQEFVEKFKSEYPDFDYVFLSIVDAYTALQLYWEAVELAGTVDQEEVAAAYESGDISVEAPSGTVAMDPETHHATQDMWLAHVDESHEVQFLDVDGNPTDEPISEQVGTSDWFASECQLASESTWDDPITEQYIPEEGDLTE
ncbi:ABC transporter substrate-binding protein [Natrarchaeobius oligotrophus]|uniref:Urea ABC transporter substrate-binding protein n=1 Tax=Natrarchaeobius chitinivorans TaxID=1679083 RepID=A0A3N6M5U8_NATCH|nr:ABC transporter substrate-binding protein [Natrarchaeobius chitinivorans]RQG98948.1 urea ABC transporter substrate-binding protein [Natrarchaeobius chitinivorans]